MRKIKMLTRRGTTSLSLAEVLRTVNPVLRGWAAYFRYGADRIREDDRVLIQPGKDAGRALPLPREPNLDPYNIDEVDPNGARFRSTSHNDAAFVGQVSEHLT